MISINVKPSVKVNGEFAGFITFPYDNTLVAMMRNVDSRYYHPDIKTWEVAGRNVMPLYTKLTGLGYDVEISGAELLEKKHVEMPNGFSFKTKPFNHQIEGFEYGLSMNKFLLGDEQGLGKTKQVIDIAIAKKLSHGYKRCLIVCCVNGLKWNWVNEIETHSHETGYILGTRVRRDGTLRIGSVKDRLEDLDNLPEDYFIVTNVETLRSKEVANKIKGLIDAGEIEMVAVDEIHKCKNPASQQSKGLLKLQPETRIAMTGTPLMNAPLDLFIILKWLGEERHSFYAFKNHYCVLGGFGGYEVIGYRNLSELQTRLGDLMLRRLKKDVLDLPEKLYLTEYVEMGAKQERIYKDVMAALREDIDKIKLSPNPLAQLIRLRQATASTEILSSTVRESAKFERLEELVEEISANGDKCIIFSNWTSVTDLVFRNLERFNPAIITGDTVDREFEKEMFMTDDTCRCIIGTIGAMGTGLTLTAANTVIFLDEPWNRANKEQAEDRAHRIGTTENVSIITLICKDTIDERIHQLVHKKGRMADVLVDRLAPEDRADLVDFLLK